MVHGNNTAMNVFMIHVASIPRIYQCCKALLSMASVLCAAQIRNGMTSQTKHEYYTADECVGICSEKLLEKNQRMGIHEHSFAVFTLGSHIMCQKQ